MFNLIPISLLILSMGGILYIVSNHLSEFNGDDEINNDYDLKLKTRFIGWINQLPIDSVKDQSLSLTQKILHRLRIFLLKSDNLLMKIIGKISKRDEKVNSNDNDIVNGGGDDFWEDIANGSNELTTGNKQEKSIDMPTMEQEAKIDFAIKSAAAEKFFDIKPIKISSEVSGKKSVKKSFKTKKSSK